MDIPQQSSDAHDASSSNTQVDSEMALGMLNSPPPPTGEVPCWLAGVRERDGETAEERGEKRRNSEGSSARVSGGAVGNDRVGSDDSTTTKEGHCRKIGENVQAGDEAVIMDLDDDRSVPLGLDVAPPASRHSYGDFSSASSTTSSSASTSGFSSHSASSATTVSSTTTFSAAGWNGLGCSPIAPQGFKAMAQKTSDGGDNTPSAESCDTVHIPAEPPLDAPPTDETVTLPSPSSLPTSSTLFSHPHTRPSSPSTASVVSSVATDSPFDDSAIIPPDNFAEVSPELYRSSFPRRANFAFLRTLGLKSIMFLVDDAYPEENVEFLREEGIQFFQFGIPGNKEPTVSITDEKLISALAPALDKRNLPMLIHCNKGKHRTGCVVGCIRRLQGLALPEVFDEYRKHSHPKSRDMDITCIEDFAGLPEVWDNVVREHLPAWAVDIAPVTAQPLKHITRHCAHSLDTMTSLPPCSSPHTPAPSFSLTP